jgi:hypothetical protein
MPEPQYDALTVIAGTAFDEVFLILDANTGDYVDWTVGTWHVEAEIHDRTGQLLARLANYGSPDGTITLSAGGLLTLHLDAAVTADLPITRTYINSTDPRVAAWRARGAHVFDLTATETVSGDVSGLVWGQITVNEPVTG